MLTVEEKKKYTIVDYIMLEEGAPFQLIKNELIMSPSPNPIHQAIVARISQILLNYLETIKDKGYTAGSVDVVFDDNNVFQPAFLYISASRRKELVKARIEGAPDIAIEILSPSNAYYDLRQKKEIYEKYGVKEYIIIDPIAQNADLYVLKDGVYSFFQRAQNKENLNSVVLPGFSIALEKLFDDE